MEENKKQEENTVDSEKTGETGTEEKNETKKIEEKKQWQNVLQSPVFVSIVCIAIIAIGAFAILSFSQPQELDWNDFQHASPVEATNLKIIVLTSTECQGCQRENSFINYTLLSNGIMPLVEEVDVDSADGQALVKTFGIRQVPFVILDEKSLNDSMRVAVSGTKAGLESVLEDNVRAELVFKKGNYYLIPEHDQTIMFLDMNSCGSKEQIKVDLISDPYCAPCALASASFNETAKQFSENINLDYNFYPVDSKKMLYVWEKIVPFANYSICAARQDSLFEFQSATYSYYCSPNDQNIYDLNNLQNCANSPHFLVPMPAQRLKEAFQFANLDVNRFGTCLEAIEKEKPLMVQSANSYGIDKVPRIVLNCKYVTNAESLKRAVCIINPGLEDCK